MGADTKENRLLTPRDVARIVGQSEAWVRRSVPHKVHLGHRTVRWFERDIEQWLESFRVTS
jgi:predicted DNA-binding transcriptional regulator AlpA